MSVFNGEAVKFVTGDIMSGNVHVSWGRPVPLFCIHVIASNINFLCFKNTSSSFERLERSTNKIP